MAASYSRKWWLPIVWGTVGCCVIALFAASSLSSTGVVFISVIGGMGTLLAFAGHRWLGAKEFPILGTIIKFPLLLCLVGSVWVGLAWIAWPRRIFKAEIDSSHDPYQSTVHVTLESGPSLGKYQLVCVNVDTWWKEGDNHRRGGGSYTERPWNNQLQAGDTASDKCMHLSIGTFEDAPPDCLDIEAAIFVPGEENPIYAKRFVAWRASSYQWHGQPINGPKDGSYCDYGVP